MTAVFNKALALASQILTQASEREMTSTACFSPCPPTSELIESCAGAPKLAIKNRCDFCHERPCRKPSRSGDAIFLEGSDHNRLQRSIALKNCKDFGGEKLLGPQLLARRLCRNVSEIFVVYILEDFAGDFRGGFFSALFPTKMRRKNPATKSAKKSGGPKIKIRGKSVLPKTDRKSRCDFLPCVRKSQLQSQRNRDTWHTQVVYIHSHFSRQDAWQTCQQLVSCSNLHMFQLLHLLVYSSRLIGLHREVATVLCRCTSESHHLSCVEVSPSYHF